MKDILFVFFVMLVILFLQKGEPSLFDLVHARIAQSLTDGPHHVDTQPQRSPYE